MVRRRLRLSYCSDEEEEGDGRQTRRPPQQCPDAAEEDDIEVQVRHSTAGLNTVTLTSPPSGTAPNHNPIPNTAEPISIEISDDDDPMEVSRDSSVRRPSSIPSHSHATASASSSRNGVADGLGCPISHHLRRLGLSLRREWLDSCIRGLVSAPGFGNFDVAQKAKLCFESFLFSDMNHAGDGVLPENVVSMHLVDLSGPFVLQVDEIVNISCPLRGRYQKAPSGLKRCLKLSMTDGLQRVFGMEYRPIKDLDVLAPSGLKVLICNVHVRRGLFLLVPEAFEILGGLVDGLDAARQRLVQEINKPPRGKRTRNGLLPSLAVRATRAAWPTEFSSAQESSANRVSQGTHSIQDSFQTAVETEIAEEVAATIVRENIENNPSSSTAVGGQDAEMVVGAAHPFLLRGDKEIPFTYLASLSANWAAVKGQIPRVKGIIKCILTGVKGFQYKQRNTFELQAYVDDGSLISEIIIDHSVVQKGIGHSPKEVTAALASVDKKLVSSMRETMKQFQMFLANFEGTMLLEMNETFPLPIALEMSQGFSTFDAWSLIRRVKSMTYGHTLQDQNVDTIDVCPD